MAPRTTAGNQWETCSSPGVTLWTRIQPMNTAQYHFVAVRIYCVIIKFYSNAFTVLNNLVKDTFLLRVTCAIV